MERLAKLVIAILIWSCILTGSVLVTKFCIWYMSGLDITSILVGLGIILAVWLTVIVELRKVISSLRRTYRIFKIKEARKYLENENSTLL